MAVLHAEAAGDDAERLEAEALVQVPRVCVAGDDGVELQDAEAARPALPETVGHQLFADVQTARFPLDRVAGVADVSAAADVVGMQDVQTVNMAGLPVLRDGGTGLLCEKGCTGGSVQQLLLRKGHAVLHNLVPDADQRRKVCLRICTNLNFYGKHAFCWFNRLFDGVVIPPEARTVKRCAQSDRKAFQVWI